MLFCVMRLQSVWLSFSAMEQHCCVIFPKAQFGADSWCLYYSSEKFCSAALRQYTSMSSPLLTVSCAKQPVLASCETLSWWRGEASLRL